MSHSAVNMIEEVDGRRNWNSNTCARECLDPIRFFAGVRVILEF
jgi:hypothetical protein